MKLSLVNCTRNRVAQILPCLEAVKSMIKPDWFELVVVDNGSTVQTSIVIDSFASRADFPVCRVDEKHPGLARARNTGWQAAHGDIVAFTDDDCYVHEDFAIAVCSFFQSHPELGFIGGRILLHDLTDLRVTILESVAERFFQPHIFIPAGAIQGANFAFRRFLLEKYGGFIPLLRAGTLFPSEDIELVARLISLGSFGAYAPSVIVRHHHGRKELSQISKLNRSYDLGRGAFYACTISMPTIREQSLKYWFLSIFKFSFARFVNELFGFFAYIFSIMIQKMQVRL